MFTKGGTFLFCSGYRIIYNPFTLSCLPHVIRGLKYLNVTAVFSTFSGLRDLSVSSSCFIEGKPSING